ncbi:DUF5719 family protein [Streptomyces xantholiticus]|uniref:DUF5719 family protein n=1 Tax=Streptomyces xantholiticus TaxID=68285 RepID=UPI00167AFEDD|nr:DUF5719 family protein [Streptomyces xantholiticus]GGW66694.1 hypothetical protein GCM10010381_59510 [Streptomyces xantholiticus]
MKRTTISLIAVATALAAITGFASLTAPDGEGAAAAEAPARLPVERSSLLCPAPSSSDLAETQYTSFTPAEKDGARQGSGGEGADADSAELRSSAVALTDPAGAPEEKDGKGKKDGAEKPASDKPFLVVKEPGKPVSAEGSGGQVPALVGTATGSLAPGWTAQQTTTVSAGSGRGLLGVSCTAPDTDFWFPGASLADKRQDYVHLTNPDEGTAVVDVELYGKEGALKSTVAEGVPVPGGSSLPLLLSTLTADQAEDVTVHVTTRTGRVGAVVRSLEENVGSDWLGAAADPSGTAVLPGIPADAASVQLVAFAPGADDAELKVQLAGATGTITPAGHETLHVKSGMTASVDLKDVTRGEAGSLILSPAEGGRATPVVAALRVVRGKGDEKEVAFIPAAAPVGERATVADNRAKGSQLSLTAPGRAATVRVTASAGTKGGTPVVKEYAVKAGTTTAVPAPVPAGLKGSYALTVETVSGGPVHASRALEIAEDGIPMFTVQTLPDDRGTVAVPEAEQDLSVLDD